MKVCSRCRASKAIDQFRKKGKYYNSHCKECEKEYQKEYFKTYIQTDKWKNKCKVYMKKRRKSDENFRLSSNMSRAIAKVLTGSKDGRSWEELVGYTGSELKKHLERYFHDGMSWENRNEWHIDHIIPKSFFKYETPDDVEFKNCWSLDNLRPMWKKDNYKKQNDIFYPFYERKSQTR